MEGGDGAAADIPGQVDPVPSTGAGDDDQISKVEEVENGPSERGGGVDDGKEGAIKSSKSQIIGGRQLLPLGQKSGHKSAGNVNAYDVDDITPDPSIPDLLSRVGKFGQAERRSSQMLLQRATSEGSVTVTPAVTPSNTGPRHLLDNNEEVTRATDSATAHEILFNRRKMADELTKTRSEGQIMVKTKRVVEVSFLNSLMNNAKNVLGNISRTLSGHLGRDTPDTSQPRSGSRRGSAKASSRRTSQMAGLAPSPSSPAPELDEEHQQLQKAVLETKDSFVMSNAPRQRWVTATWYAAQEAQRLHTEEPQEKLNLVEAVKAVMVRDEAAIEEQAKEAARERKNVQIRAFIDSPAVTLTTVFATVFVLYAADIHFLINDDPSGDGGIYAVTFVCTIIFVVEVVLRSAIRTKKHNKFFLSFFFWLDIVAIISLIPDIVFWFSSLGKPRGISDGYNMWTGQGGGDSQASSAQAEGGFDFLTLARSGRAARAGARSTRIIRVLNLVSKMNKIRHHHLEKEDNKAEKGDQTYDAEIARTPSNDDKPPDDGNDMGSKLDRRISRYFVYCVGTMLTVAIILSAALERNFPAIVEDDLRRIALIYHSTGLDSSSPLWLDYLDEYSMRSTNEQSILLYIGQDGNVLYGNNQTMYQYRTSPQTVINLATIYQGHKYTIHIADIDNVRGSLIGNICFTSAVLAILGGLTWIMSSAVRQDIVIPMEGLMGVIKSIRKDPMKPIPKAPENEEQVREVVNVQQALVQLGALLQMGLGEAGAKIIRSSLKDNGLDVNVAGKIVQAIYGFCDIRNFTDCTEVLQADVVKLVNNVGSIVHDVTIENHGAPNKNIGDAFLLVWKPKGSLTVTQIAESALRSYVTIIIEMTRDQVLRKWAARSDIQDRMPGYVVRLGCGLHYGWAIECAIGSQHKIDASYLSPHVNLSSRLEAATKQYGAMILFSGEMHGLMSDEVRSLCRLLDRVTVKGSNAPMYLYTFDVPSLKQFGGTLADDIELGLKKVALYDYWKKVRPYTSEKFRLQWQMAMHAYLGGPDGSQADWEKSKSYFNKCLAMIPDDGPAKAIMSYMGNNSVGDGDTFKCPESWKGFRGLTDK